jgi:drug/metabolite transporter (DMT)-like permease
MNLINKNITLVLPFLFIIIYGSGFVATKYGLEYITPLAFLVIRFLIAFIFLVLISIFLKSHWPDSLKEIFHISIAGTLTVAVFSIGVYISINLGVSPALSALIIALQPIIVAIFASKFLGEVVEPKHWLGLVVGFVGVFFVVFSKFDFGIDEILGILMSVFALLGLSFGNIYQKKYCTNMNLFTGGAIQTFVSFLISLMLMILFEDIQITWNVQLVYSVLYMSIGVSITALSLLYIMIKAGEVSKVSSVFYLIPVCAVVMSYILFDDAFDITELIGIIVVVIGVGLINNTNNIMKKINFFKNE